MTAWYDFARLPFSEQWGNNHGKILHFATWPDGTREIADDLDALSPDIMDYGKLESNLEFADFVEHAKQDTEHEYCIQVDGEMYETEEGYPA